MSKFTDENELVLQRALKDVPIPPGLEDRLLAAVAKQELSSSVEVSTDAKPKSGFSRRGLIWAAAAAVGGVAVTGGNYLFAGRRLDEPELVAEVDKTLRADDRWKFRSLKTMPPINLAVWFEKRPSHWQPISMELASNTVAFNISQSLSAKAILFAIPVKRNVSHFPVAIPSIPQVVRSGPQWQQIAYWQDPRGWDGSKVLFVMAADGTRRDYDSLITGSATPPVA